MGAKQLYFLYHVTNNSYYETAVTSIIYKSLGLKLAINQDNSIEKC